MSLDTEKLHRLKSKSFDTLYDDHPEKWPEMFNSALGYAQTCVGAGEKVRVGDIVAIMENAIRIDPTFEAHTKNKSLPQKYWINWFAEYIVDRVHPQPQLKAVPKTKKP